MLVNPWTAGVVAEMPSPVDVDDAGFVAVLPDDLSTEKDPRVDITVLLGEVLLAFAMEVVLAEAADVEAGWLVFSPVAAVVDIAEELRAVYASRVVEADRDAAPIV